MTTSFAVTWDYRCPFARNAHEHILTGLEAGADWDVRFLPFSLKQNHVEEGEPTVWEKPDQDSGIVALQAGVVVRDTYPELFPAVHRALFAARHDRALHTERPDVTRQILVEQGVDADAVFAAIGSGAPLETVREEHEGFVASHGVWGVPTFIIGDAAYFARLMNRPQDVPDGTSQVWIDRILDMVGGWPELNEFKRTVLTQ